jgi:hypothetical protein
MQEYKLRRLIKTTKNLSQDCLSPGRDLNPGVLEYETGKTIFNYCIDRHTRVCISCISFYFLFEH